MRDRKRSRFERVRDERAADARLLRLARRLGKKARLSNFLRRLVTSSSPSPAGRAD